MVPNRSRIVLLVVAVLTVTAGCSGGILGGDGPIEASASPVSVSDSALQEANFEEEERREVTIDRTVNVQDQERQVKITNHAAVYRSAGDTEAVGVAVVSTPNVEAFGIPLNPVASMDIGDAVTFASQAGAQLDGSIQNLEEVDSWETTVLGTETTVTKFAATVERDGQQIEVFVHATKVTDGEDIVLVIGVYPQALEEEGMSGQDTLQPMFEGVQHETE